MFWYYALFIALKQTVLPRHDPILPKIAVVIQYDKDNDSISDEYIIWLESHMKSF